MLLHRWVHIRINEHTPILFCALWDRSLYFLIWLFLINQSTHDSSFHVSSSPFLLHSAYVSACLFECVCTRDCVFVCVKERYVGPWIYVCTCTHALVDALYYVDMEMRRRKFIFLPHSLEKGCSLNMRLGWCSASPCDSMVPGSHSSGITCAWTPLTFYRGTGIPTQVLVHD